VSEFEKWQVNWFLFKLGISAGETLVSVSTVYMEMKLKEIGCVQVIPPIRCGHVTGRLGV